MIKKIFYVLLFLALPFLTAQSQTMKVYQSGISYYGTISSMDSLSTYFSNTMDWSQFDGQTVYIAFELISAGGTSDTITIKVQPVMPELNSSSATTASMFAPTAIDSVIKIGATSSSIAYSSSTVTQTSFTLTKWAGLYRLVVFNTAQVTANRKGKTFKWYIYAKALDTQPYRISLGNSTQ